MSRPAARPEEVRALFPRSRLIGRRFRLAHRARRARGLRGGDVSRGPRSRRRRPRGDAPPRQRLRYPGRRRGTPGFHRQRPLLRRPRRLGPRLHGGDGRSRRGAHPFHRRSGRPVPRGPRANAPGGAFRGEARVPDRGADAGPDLRPLAAPRGGSRRPPVRGGPEAVPERARPGVPARDRSFRPASASLSRDRGVGAPRPPGGGRSSNARSSIRTAESPRTCRSAPGFLVAALMWGPVRDRAETFGEGDRERGRGEALAAAADEALAVQAKRTSMPRRFSAMARDIWTMQPRLENRRPRRVDLTIAHPPVPRRVRLPVPACGGRRASRGARRMVDRGPGGWRGSGSGG